MYLNVHDCDKFLNARNGKIINFGFFRPNLRELVLFYHSLYVNVVLDKFQ